jgi:hypothetical protein
MKKVLIGTLVGGLIIFIWQFLSWSALNIHGSEQQYTENQDIILECLGENLQEGHYFLPTVPPGTSSEDAQSLMEEVIGQPWAQVSYHKSFEADMGMNMFRGLVIDWLAVYLLIWVFMKSSELRFSPIFVGSLCVGFVGYLTIPYLNSIWFETPTWGYIVDTAVQWGLVGAWLGWWLPRE